MSRYVAQLRQTLPAPAPTEAIPTGILGTPPLPAAALPPLQKPLSTRTAVWLMMRFAEELMPEQQATLAQPQALVPEISTAYPVVQDFRHLLRERTGGSLESWLRSASESGVRELQGFAAGLGHDLAAVQNGVSMKWNNG